MTDIYVTTSIPYVNARPHIGFALELVQADAIARYHRLAGRKVVLQTGTDENALKNVLAARRQGLTTRQLVDRNARAFRELATALSLSADTFVRTAGAGHRRAVHDLWRRLDTADLCRRAYRGLYCTGCEDFYLPRDLVDGRCPEHGAEPTCIEETNWFFRLSRWQDAVEAAVASGRLRVVPEKRRNEVLSFVRGGLEDFSVSRDARRAGGWGIAVPGDEQQTIYVWVDALTNYLTGRGLGDGDGWRRDWNERTRKIHVIGKNVWKFHAVYWPALLLSAGLPLPNEVVVHGFLTVEGRKIGKSLGNAVDPFACIEQFGPDAVRYYLLRAVPAFDDGDFSLERLRQVYNADLANGLGNLVSRLTSLAERAGLRALPSSAPPEPPADYARAFEDYQFGRAAAAIWARIAELNRRIEAARPWELLRGGHVEAIRRELGGWLADLHGLAYWVAPLLPEASARILQALSRGPIRHGEPLFPRR